MFGLSGPWGAGKTSTLNLIKNALEDPDEDSADRWTVVFFTPWAVNDPYALAEEFYRTIASAMPKNKGEGAKKLLNAAAPALAAGAKALFHGVVNRYAGEGTSQNVAKEVMGAAADTAGEFRIEEDPFAERFKKIEKAIEELDIRVVVVVDDIDRLHHDELLAVMKAVRLLGRFNGVHYLLSYDIQTVTDVLTRSDLAHGNRRRAEQYLEKIVQYPFELPPIQLVHLRRVIDDHLRDVGERGGYALDNKSRHLDVLLSRLPMDDLTLRTVHRLFAQADMMLSLVGKRGAQASHPSDEIDLLDAVLLTYLRLEYPQLYRSLRSWKSELTQPEGQAIDRDEEHERMKVWRDRVANLVDSEGKNETTTVRAHTVLRALFPQSVPRIDKSYRAVPEEAPRQIRQREYFDRYFTFGFPATDLRDADIRAELVQLISTGDLPTDSLIHLHADNPEMRSLLHIKLQALLTSALGQITDMGHCGKAAIALTRAATDQERREPHVDAWWATMSFQLWEALDAYNGSEAARAAVTAYLNEFGTDVTATALHVGRDQITPGLQAASQPVWERIHDDFVAALLDNDPHLSDPTAVTRNWFWIRNQPGLIEKASYTIRQRTAIEGTLDLIGVAARLVTADTRPGDPTRHLAFLGIDHLMDLVPQTDWPDDQIPDELIPDIDRTDLSYSNRRNLASNCIFNALHNQPQQH